MSASVSKVFIGSIVSTGFSLLIVQDESACPSTIGAKWCPCTAIVGPTNESTTGSKIKPWLKPGII